MLIPQEPQSKPSCSPEYLRAVAERTAALLILKPGEDREVILDEVCYTRGIDRQELRRALAEIAREMIRTPLIGGNRG